MGNLVLDETWCYHGEPLVDDLLLGWGFVRSRAAPLLQAIESLKKGHCLGEYANAKHQEAFLRLNLPFHCQAMDI